MVKRNKRKRRFRVKCRDRVDMVLPHKNGSYIVSELKKYMSEKLSIKPALKKLCRTYALGARYHKEYPELVQIGYDHFNSPPNSAIVQEARSFILNINSLEVVAWGFTRFFNCNEPYVHIFDWSSFKVYKKEDGSIITLYYYKKKWHVATKNGPDATGYVCGKNYNFSYLFFDMWKKLGYELPKDRTKCYVFELVSPRNKNLIKAEEDRLVLIGVRCMKTYQEYSPSIVEKEHLNWEIAKPLKGFTCKQDIVDASLKLNLHEQEGFVVVDRYFQRLKIKNPQYVALSFLRPKQGSNNVNNMITIIKINEGDEFLAYHSRWKPLYASVKNSYDELVKHIVDKWKMCKRSNHFKMSAKKLNIVLRGFMGTLRYEESVDENIVRKKLSKLSSKEIRNMIDKVVCYEY